MAIKVETGKVYKCIAPTLASASIHVVSGSAKIKGSNVTKNDEVTKKLIVPKFAELVDTGDDLKLGINLLAGLPEWIGFEGNGEIWIKMGIDVRIEPAGE